MKKIILSNIVVLIILFVILEFLSYLYLKEDAKSYIEPYNKNAKEKSEPLLTQKYGLIRVFDQNAFENNYRAIYKGSPKKPSILFFGCSYTYGYGLDDNGETTLPYLTGKKADVTTINRGISGGSILNTLFDLKNDNLYSKLKNLPVPKYIVYTYINDHLNRISNPYRSSVRLQNSLFYEINPEFKTKNDELKEIKPSFLKKFLYALYTTKAYYYFYAQNFARVKATDRLFELFDEAKKITDEKFPNSKFIILLYKDGSHYTMDENLIEKLKADGFIVLDAEKLAGHELETDKWRSGDKEHPNAAAFSDVAEGLIKELNL